MDGGIGHWTIDTCMDSMPRNKPIQKKKSNPGCFKCMMLKNHNDSDSEDSYHLLHISDKNINH